MPRLAVGALPHMRLAPKCGRRTSRRCVIPLASALSARSIEPRPLDHEHDLEDRRAGRRIACPLLVLWSGRGPLGTWYAEDGGPLALWHAWATNVRGSPLDAGHFFPEEIPQRTAEELGGFFATTCCRRKGNGADSRSAGSPHARRLDE